MRIYNAQQENMFFLSPYSQTQISETTLSAYSTLFSTTAQLSCTQQQAQSILSMLKEGVDEDTLYSFFQRELPTIDMFQFLNDWMRKGLVE